MSDKIEYVYILTNPAMPEWVKVGKSNNIPRRINDLNCTAVPLPFECYAALKVPADCVYGVEKGLQTFLGFSYQKEKEFFRTSPDEVLKYFKNAKLMNPSFEIIKGDKLEEESEAEKKRTKQTTFALCSVPLGSQLVFTRDSSVVCEVLDDKNKVKYKNKTYSISALASELLGYNVNGYVYFMFEDETLWNRRQRLHPEL